MSKLDTKYIELQIEKVERDFEEAEDQEQKILEALQKVKNVKQQLIGRHAQLTELLGETSELIPPELEVESAEE